MAGTLKDIGGQLLHGFLSYRPTRMNEPHICEAISQEGFDFIVQANLLSSWSVVLNFCFTHPKHRRRGVGRLLMEWGIKKADELGLPSYIEATDIGLKLYEANGFKVEGELDLDASTENPSAEFTQLREKLGCPIHGWFMRRPKYGKHEQ
jgi:GNAT superfamily N-acetyltransferase